MGQLCHYCSGSQPGVHGPLSSPQKISGGPQDSKFCITVNRRGSTGYRKIAIGGLSQKKWSGLNFVSFNYVHESSPLLIGCDDITITLGGLY